MITKKDLLEAQAAAEQLFPEFGISHHTARDPLDASPPEPHAPEPRPITGSLPRPADSPAAASAAVPFSLRAILQLVTDTRAQVEAQIYAAVRDAQLTTKSDDLYDQLRAIQQECCRLNDCAYKLWLAHACESLKHP